MNENNDEIKKENDEVKETEENKDKKKKEKKVWFRKYGKHNLMLPTGAFWKEVLEWVVTLAVAFAVAFVIKQFVFDIVKVDGSSMVPTLHDGDRLIVTKLGYQPKQGDIIILDSTYKNRMEYFDSLAKDKGKEHLSSMERFFAERSGMPANLNKRYYVKRVIALPGQTVKIEGGHVYIDDELLDESSYYTGLTSTQSSTEKYEITVEENTVFVMGDNRNNSKDSRSPELGLVPYGAILGKAQLRIWPLNAIGATK